LPSVCWQTRQQETTALRRAMKGLQALEDSLPYDHHKRIREDIPVGVYDVIADFGQARGGQYRNDSAKRKLSRAPLCRTILCARTSCANRNIFEGTSRAFAAAVGEDQAKELTSDGNFYRTLWHEVGHYLASIGPKTAAISIRPDGRRQRAGRDES